MHVGKIYSVREVLRWTRRDIAYLFFLTSLPTILYQVLGWKWLIIPWVPIALLGTAVAFIVGFKNNASYDRAWEARKAWGGIVNASRAWASALIGFLSPPANGNRREVDEARRKLVYRQIAWLTALRFQLRENRSWESVQANYNQDYIKRTYQIPEKQQDLKTELGSVLSPEEREHILSRKNRATHILALQSKDLQELREKNYLNEFQQVTLQNLITELYNQQGVCERIKNYPYPRQFATVNYLFTSVFILLLPFGMIKEFEKLGEHFVWLNIPFCMLVSWVFTTLEKVGESTENPFEGVANDVPITALSRTIEIDLRELLGETEIPPAHQPVHNILM